MRRRFWYVILCIAASGVLAVVRTYAQGNGPKPVLTPAVQKHLKEFEESLPPDDVLRYALEHGAHGDGVHGPWIDEMRQQGINRVVVQTEFRWDKRPTDVRATYFVYFSTYDGDCGQVADPLRLSKIRSSGLETELGKEAVRRTFEAPWLMGKPHHVKGGGGIFRFLSDPWLLGIPNDLGYLVPAPKRPLDHFDAAVDMGDVAAVKQFLREGVTTEKRNGAVWALTGVPTPCTLRALLQGGTDPNMRDRYGSPLLTEEIRHDNFENAKVLVEAGADVNAKNASGFTPLSVAEGIQDGLREQHTPNLPAMPDIIRLLKAAGARN